MCYQHHSHSPKRISIPLKTFILSSPSGYGSDSMLFNQELGAPLRLLWHPVPTLQQQYIHCPVIYFVICHHHQTILSY